MSSLLMELIGSIRQGAMAAHDAALALGLLIEREKVHRLAGDDGGIRVILGDEWVDRRLTDAELQTVVDELIRYIRDVPAPHAMAVWALTKSYESRIVPALIELLERVLTDKAQENVAYQALIGIINTGLASPYQDLAITAVQQAARQGQGRVQETASEYLLKK
jgi:hypothetical protein